MTDRGLKIRETFRKKYGVDHPSQLLSVKEKIKQKRLSGAYDNVVKKILKVYDPTLSEWENMQLNGYDRIWDCGNYKFEWKENI